MKYSPSTGGFYAPEIHGDNTPIDAVAVSASAHAALLAAQAAGARIVPGEGGYPVAQPPPPPTADQKAAARVAAVQAHMDAAAAARGYDDIKTAVTYADEPAVPRFQAEGQAFRAWRSIVWAHCYQVLDDVQAGRRAIPSAADLIAELPALHIAYPADPPPDA
jgi:hypothetical protein